MPPPTSPPGNPRSPPRAASPSPYPPTRSRKPTCCACRRRNGPDRAPAEIASCSWVVERPTPPSPEISSTSRRRPRSSVARHASFAPRPTDLGRNPRCMRRRWSIGCSRAARWSRSPRGSTQARSRSLCSHRRCSLPSKSESRRYRAGSAGR